MGVGSKGLVGVLYLFKQVCLRPTGGHLGSYMASELAPSNRLQPPLMSILEMAG